MAAARYYDGIVPAPRSVSIAVSGPMLLIVAADGAELARWVLSDLQLPGQDDSLGEAMITSRAQPDARLLLSDPQAIALLQPHLPEIARIVAPRPAAVRTWAFLAIVAGAVLAATALVVWRGPELLAPLVPASWEEGLGDVVADNITEHFGGSCTNGEGSAALETMTRGIIAASGYERPLRITVVRSKIVNALALPGGRVILFDGLIQEAVTPDEVAGVFAHELGHVVHRHPMRGLLRQMGISLLRRMALGSYGDAADIAGGLGETVLVLRNGRDAEREADAAALGYLAAAGLRQNGLHDFFARLQKKGDAGADLGILSTHPPLAERMESTQRSDEGRPALDHGQWQALRKICAP